MHVSYFLFQIRLQIKRSVARRNAGQISFKDRDVDDVVDGYVACEPYKDSHVWEHSQVMERAMQVINCNNSFSREKSSGMRANFRFRLFHFTHASCDFSRQTTSVVYIAK